MSDFFIHSPDNTIITDATTQILKSHDAYQFHRSLPGYTPTPCLNLRWLAKKYHTGSIFIKDESKRFHLEAFKALGASYAVHRILQQYSHIDTLCTATDGNHGRALAWASARAGKKSVVFVPHHTAPARIRAIEQEGGKAIKIEGNYDEACDLAAEACRKDGWQLVQDAARDGYEEIPALIMAGYLTQFRELEPELHPPGKPDVDIAFLQAGVGSFAASAIWYYLDRYGPNRPKIILVEPFEADGVLASFRAGERVVPDKSFKTMMAGLNCGIPSPGAWNIIRSGTDAVVSISDHFAAEAMQALYHPAGTDQPVTAGESGAAGLAGFMAVMEEEKLKPVRELLRLSPESRVLFVNTEGATDPDNFRSITSKTTPPLRHNQ